MYSNIKLCYRSTTYILVIDQFDYFRMDEGENIYKISKSFSQYMLISSTHNNRSYVLKICFFYFR